MAAFFLFWFVGLANLLLALRVFLVEGASVLCRVRAPCGLPTGGQQYLSCKVEDISAFFGVSFWFCCFSFSFFYFHFCSHELINRIKQNTTDIACASNGARSELVWKELEWVRGYIGAYLHLHAHERVHQQAIIENRSLNIYVCIKEKILIVDRYS